MSSLFCNQSTASCHLAIIINEFLYHQQKELENFYLCYLCSQVYEMVTQSGTNTSLTQKDSRLNKQREWERQTETEKKKKKKKKKETKKSKKENQRKAAIYESKARTVKF